VKTSSGGPSGWSGWSTDHPVGHPSTTVYRPMSSTPSNNIRPKHALEGLLGRGANNIRGRRPDGLVAGPMDSVAAWTTARATSGPSTRWTSRFLHVRQRRLPATQLDRLRSVSCPARPPPPYQHQQSRSSPVALPGLAWSPELPPSPANSSSGDTSRPSPSFLSFKLSGFFRSLVLLIGECFF
jgi:hypothetical protein